MKKILFAVIIALPYIIFDLTVWVPRIRHAHRIEQALSNAWATFDQAAAAKNQPEQQYSLIKLLITRSDAVTKSMSGGSYSDRKHLDSSADNLGRCQTTLIFYRNVSLDPTQNDAMRTRISNMLSSCIEKHQVNF